MMTRQGVRLLALPAAIIAAALAWPGMAPLLLVILEAGADFLQQPWLVLHGLGVVYAFFISVLLVLLAIVPDRHIDASVMTRQGFWGVLLPALVLPLAVFLDGTGGPGYSFWQPAQGAALFVALAFCRSRQRLLQQTKTVPHDHS